MLLPGTDNNLRPVIPIRRYRVALISTKFWPCHRHFLYHGNLQKLTDRRKQRIAALQGKMIGISGTIELYQGKPEIKVLSVDQIKGSDFQPVK